MEYTCCEGVSTALVAQGVSFRLSVMLRRLSSLFVSASSAVTATGTVCRFSSNLRAVTMISSMARWDDAEAASSAAGPSA